jgi:methionyl aminopeptidase
VNEVVCHGIPDARPLEEGDIVNLDVSLLVPEAASNDLTRKFDAATMEGQCLLAVGFPLTAVARFHGDVNATYAVGAIDADSQRVIDATKQSLQAAIDICKPGTLFRNIGKVIEPIVEAKGCKVNRRCVALQ